MAELEKEVGLALMGFEAPQDELQSQHRIETSEPPHIK
jgi:hypothetical protein